MVRSSLSRETFQGLQQIGGITKVEIKIGLTTGCTTTLYLYATQK